MDIRKRKLKGYIALSILLILCLIMASAMIFFIGNNKIKDYSDNITTLATSEPVINDMTFEMGTSRYYYQTSAYSPTLKYSQMTSSASDPHIGAQVEVLQATLYMVILISIRKYSYLHIPSIR